MPPSIQNLLTVAIVVLAAGYLLRRAWTVFAGKRQGGCGGCASCSSEDARSGPQLVSVESLLEPVRKRAN